MKELQPTIVAIFDDRLEAERGVSALENAGFPSDQIGYVMRGLDVSRGGMITDAAGAKDSRGAVAGAATGAVVGGVLAAGAAMLIPGVGPIISAGLLTTFLGGAVAGTAVGGILGAMTGLGVSEDEARYYEKMFHEGKAIVAVRAGDRYSDAIAILAEHGGCNLRQRAGSPIPTHGTFSQS